MPSVLPATALVRAHSAVGDMRAYARAQAEAAAYSPHLADSVLEAHVRPCLLPALEHGAKILAAELSRLERQRERNEAKAAAVPATTGALQEGQGGIGAAGDHDGAACIWLSDDLNAELIVQRT